MYDTIQSRYGFATDEYLMGIPYARLVQLAEQAAIGVREDYRRSAFLGWQLASTLAPVPRFEEYLESLGLGPGGTPKTATKEEALARAAAIVAMDQGR